MNRLYPFRSAQAHPELPHSNKFLGTQNITLVTLTLIQCRRREKIIIREDLKTLIVKYYDFKKSVNKRQKLPHIKTQKLYNFTM